MPSANGTRLKPSSNETIELARTRRDRYHEAVALVNLGNVHLFRDRFDHALQFFERVLAFKDLESQLVYSVALTNAGICYYRLGEIDRAIDAQRRAVASHERPGRPRVYYERALGELGNDVPRQAETPRARSRICAGDGGREGGRPERRDAALWAVEPRATRTFARASGTRRRK